MAGVAGLALVQANGDGGSPSSSVMIVARWLACWPCMPPPLHTHTHRRGKDMVVPMPVYEDPKQTRYLNPEFAAMKQENLIMFAGGWVQGCRGRCGGG